MGCVGLTVQTSSRSCSLRQRSVQVVPISLPKIFDQCPECSTTRPMPGQHVPVHPLDDLVGHLGVGGVPPPDQHVGAGEHLLGEPVLGLVERGRADDRRIAEVLLDALGDRRVHALRVDLRDRAARAARGGSRPRSGRFVTGIFLLDGSTAVT